MKREVGRGQRDLDRERGQLERDEKKIISDIRAAAKRGNQGETRILAKQLVQLRTGKNRLLSTKAQLGAIKTKTTLMATTHTMAQTMQTATKSMAKANKAMNPEKMAKQMKQMEMEMMKMDMTEEMMSDTLMDAFDEEGTEEDADAITRQVLDEIGVDSTAALGVAPTHKASKTKEDEAQELPDFPDMKAVAS